MPTKNSLLCSDHFSPNCFNVYNKMKILKPNSLPTISTHQEMFRERSNILIENNHGNINESIARIEEIPQADMCTELIDASTSSRESFDEDSYEKVRHDHHYVNTPRSTLKKLRSIQRRLGSSQKSNKLLKRKVKHLQLKVHSLKEVVKCLKEKKLLPDNAFYNLSALEDTTL
ncbi:THAP domain-containing protein 5-like [Lasioglossum baleicum]|uniref:THAP domain-containing protein 5-like n=1 Tax=Lasioglossum baleicum TaxID=434251 RepID=UPI003FCC537B